MTSTSAPTVGIVGLGYGRAHIPAFQAHGCRVVALCQRDRAATQAIAARYGVPDVFDRWEEMLDAARPDIVVIATPPHLHHAIALRAFEAGAHVLCEKPLAMTAAEGRAMADAARRAGRVAMTSFNWWFPAAMRELHARVRRRAGPGRPGRRGRVRPPAAGGSISRRAGPRPPPARPGSLGPAAASKDC